MGMFKHYILPFLLLDKTKPSHRKILVLFLVDPHIRIISLANVPCQQWEWWAQQFEGQGPFWKFPTKMWNTIIHNVVEFSISIEESKESRLELMNERKVFIQRHDQKFTLETFSLCEH